MSSTKSCSMSVGENPSLSVGPGDVVGVAVAVADVAVDVAVAAAAVDVAVRVVVEFNE